MNLIDFGLICFFLINVGLVLVWYKTTGSIEVEKLENSTTESMGEKRSSELRSQLEKYRKTRLNITERH